MSWRLRIEIEPSLIPASPCDQLRECGKPMSGTLNVVHLCERLVQRIRNSHHIGATHEANFGFTSCTGKLLFLVWFSNLKFLQRACHPCDRNFKFTTLVLRIRNSHHIGATHEANFGFTSCTGKLLFLVWR